MNQKLEKILDKVCANFQPVPEFEQLTKEEKSQIIDGMRERAQEMTRQVYKRQQEQERIEAWERMVPELYREPFDPSKLKDTPEQFEKRQHVRLWPYQARGHLLLGPTGRGKTRTTWDCLRSHYFDGRSIKWLGGVQFANEAAAAARDTELTEKWVRGLVKPDILFIDDLGKRFTPSSAPILFDVVERRMSNKRPMWITTNLTRDQLDAVIGDPELAGPLMRRIVQFCDPVAL